MAKKNDILILFTEEFPFSIGETFIENEIEHLSINFERIYIVSKDLASNLKRPIPGNVTVIRKVFNLSKIEKLLSFFYVFKKDVVSEILNLKNYDLKISFHVIKYLFNTYSKSIKVKYFLEKFHSNLQNHEQLFIYSYWFMDEAIGIAQYKKSNKKFIGISRAHGFDLYFERSKYKYLPFKKFAFENLNRVYFISKDGMLYSKYKFNLPNLNITNISYLGTSNKNQIKLNLRSSKPLLIYSCSHIYPNKRIELIAASVENLKFKFKWEHFGDYLSSIDKSYVTKIKNEILRLQNKGLDIKMHGKLYNNEILQKLNNHNYGLHINLSASEGIPVTIMEAFSFGIPVIATDVGGVNEIVIDGYNGFLVNKNFDIKTVHELILKFNNLDLPERIQICENAKKTWEEKFNADSNYPLFLKEIKKINEKS